MQGWSLPVGRVFGVEIRVHPSLPLLLLLSAGFASASGATVGRGFVLWLLLLAAIAVRELARALLAAWYGLPLRSLLLLPTGGWMRLGAGNGEDGAASTPDPAVRRAMALVGPAASFVFGLVLLAVMLTLAPRLPLLRQPWISPGYLLRSAIWINLLLGAINLLPAAPLDGGRVLGTEAPGEQGLPRSPGGMSLGPAQIAALLLIMGGLLLPNIWLIGTGGMLLIGSQMRSGAPLLENEANAVRMRDVMLTDFTTLSASDTLEAALDRALHSLQDVFPVVRGGNMVGAVSRQGIMEALENSGNGYVQGIMTRSFQIAAPGDSLVGTLKRILSGRSIQLVPVVEDERILGIITPQNLAHSMGLLHLRRRLAAREG